VFETVVLGKILGLRGSKWAVQDIT